MDLSAAVRLVAHGKTAAEPDPARSRWLQQLGSTASSSSEQIVQVADSARDRFLKRLRGGDAGGSKKEKRVNLTFIGIKDRCMRMKLS